MTTYILFFTAIIAGLINKKSKWISAYILTVMFILSVYKYNCADLVNYEAEYNNVLNGFLFESKYMGHYFIIMICSRIGFTFVQYLHVYYFVSLGFLYIALKKFTLNINVVLSFYMIYSFGIDAIQMKTMLADALILYAISFLIEAKIDRNEKRNSIKKIGLFCVFSISSIAIHFTSILFFLVGFIYYLVDDKKYRKYIYLFTSVVFVLSYMNILPKLVLYVGRFFPVFDIEYVTSWMEHEVQLGWIVLIPPIVLSLFLVKIAKNLPTGFQNNKEYSIACEISNFSYSICTVIPLFLYNTSFVRYLRVYVILFGVILSKLIILKKGLKIKFNKKQVEIFVVFIIVLGYLYLYDITPYFDTTIGAILKYNSLLN